MSDDAQPSSGGVKIWRFLPVIAFLGVAGAFYVQLFNEGRDDLPSTLIDKPAPEVDLPGLRAPDLGLSTADLNAPGVKLVNIWASWCGPCRVEHPFLMELAADGVTVHGINYKDQTGQALAFLNELGDPYTRIGADVKGREGINWGVYGVPETFVINGDGEIVYKHVGPIQNSDLDTKIRPAIAAAGG